MFDVFIRPLRARLHLDAATIRLSLTYLAIIMAMSVGFSIIFYHTSSAQLDRPLLPGRGAQIRHYDENLGVSYDDRRYMSRNELDALLQQRSKEGREALVRKLVLVNILALAAGLGISYVLARRSLLPIEQSMNAQNQFVGDVSHELRTPLTALLSTNEVALRQSKLPAHEARELIRHNVEEVQKLHRLTDSMLDLLRQDGEPLLTQPTVVQDTVRDAINSVMQLAVNKKISINDADVKHAVLANPVALVRIITILLDNAIKYSPSGSAIAVSTTQRGKQVAIRVIDKGVGIDPQDVPHVFTRLYRADTSRRTSAANGYGLGLSIAKQLVERMHGGIGVESAPGHGSTFTVTMPAAKLTGTKREFRTAP